MYSFHCRFVNKFPAFMKLQGSSPSPQKPVIRPHVEPADFSYSACPKHGMGLDVQDWLWPVEPSLTPESIFSVNTSNKNIS